MAFSMIRPLRRVVIKKFGGYKRFFLVLLLITLIVYIIRSLILDSGRIVWDVSRSPVNKSKDECDVSCLPGQFSFFIRTGEKIGEAGSLPIICFEGKKYMSAEQKNTGRGLNIVQVDSITRTVKGAYVFDTYADESPLLRFLKRDVKDDDIVLIATYDDAAYGLKDSGRKWLSLYGSSLIKNLGFRENFIMIGHRGLEMGYAIEFYKGKKSRSDEGFAPSIHKAGCFSFPLGKKVDVGYMVPDVLKGKQIKLGKHIENCGLSEPCPAGSVSVAVDTGLGSDRKPSICVDGFARMDEKTNDAGRGFNIVILDKNTLQPTNVTHMDTYTYDSSDLELLLEALHPNEIMITVIADDASRRLTQNARDLLNKLGSGHIQNLRFRDVWYFVGQKGLQGFSKHEQMSFAAFNGGWPVPITAQFCLPRIIPTTQIIVEPELPRNDKRREFCLKYEGYTDFCNPAYVDEVLEPIPTAHKDSKIIAIFETPLIIVPGLNHNAYAHTLQTTIMQPGIAVSNVAVFTDEKLPEYGELASLFGFQNFTLSSSVTYSEQLIKALQLAPKMYPAADHFIIIEEDLLLAPDFMLFMASCLSVVKQDPTLAGAFAWNLNGFEGVSGDNALVYRVQDFPGLGSLIKTPLLRQLMDMKETCCRRRAWAGWDFGDNKYEMLMPDVSRVYRTPFFGAQATSNLARTLFLKPRKTYLDTENTNLELMNLMSKEYEEFLLRQIKVSVVIRPEVLAPCLRGQAPPPSDGIIGDNPLVIYYLQKNSNDYELLTVICKCFGLISFENSKPKNMHHGLLRFYYLKHDIFVVGTMTQYFIQQGTTDVITQDTISK